MSLNKDSPLFQAADEALAALPDGRVREYLYSQKNEVMDMLLTEYDEQAVIFMKLILLSGAGGMQMV